MTERRRFIATASGVVAAAATAAFVDAPNVIAQPKVQWRLSTAYPPSLDQLHVAAQRLAQVVEESSSGRFRIEVFASGQIVQAFECLTRPPRAPSRPSCPPRCTGLPRSPRSSGSGPSLSA